MSEAGDSSTQHRFARTKELAMEPLDALLKLGREIDRKSDDFGASPKPLSELLFIAIGWLKGQICPYRDEIKRKATGPAADLSNIVTEWLIVAIGGSLPGIPTIARCIVVMGIDHFCEMSDADALEALKDQDVNATEH